MKTDTIIQLTKICELLDSVLAETNMFNYFVEDDNINKTIRDMEIDIRQTIRNLEVLIPYEVEKINES